MIQLCKRLFRRLAGWRECAVTRAVDEHYASLPWWVHESPQTSQSWGGNPW